MKKIKLLGNREGLGTFDTFFNTENYSSKEQALAAKDVVVADFMQDDNGVNYVWLYNINDPIAIKTYRLQIQRPMFGIDMIDDNNICNLAASLY